MSWDGFISYDGVLYGLPSNPPVAGAVVLVRERQRELRMFYQGQLIATVRKHPRSQEMVLHPDQFRDVAPRPHPLYDTVKNPSDTNCLLHPWRFDLWRSMTRCLPWR